MNFFGGTTLFADRVVISSFNVGLLNINFTGRNNSSVLLLKMSVIFYYSGVCEKGEVNLS